MATTNELYLNRKKIKESIKRCGFYSAQEIRLKLLGSNLSSDINKDFLENNSVDINLDSDTSPDINKEYFVGTIKREKNFFAGTLNWKFEREGYSYNESRNGDKYLGCFEKDKRNGQGFYLWKKEGKKVEFYHGLWKDDSKGDLGIYLWIDDDKNDAVKTNFEAFIGNMADDKFNNGTYLIKNKKDYFLYYGKFTPDGKRTDDNAYFYYSDQDKLFKGKIDDGNLSEGYVAYFENQEKLTDFMYVKLNKEDDRVQEIKTNEELKGEEIENLKEEMTIFRNLILTNDYFDIVYKDYKNCCKYISDNFESSGNEAQGEEGDNNIVSKTKPFEDKESFKELEKICRQFNENNITVDIRSVLSEFKKKTTSEIE